MQLFHLHARRRRAKAASLVLLLGLAGLGATFFRVQVMSTTRYTVRSQANRLRPLRVPAPRGTIYDRGGRILADNVPGYTLLLLPMSEDSTRSALEQLAEPLDFDEKDVRAALVRRRRFPNRPLVVSSDLTFDQVSALEERRAFLPGALIEMRPERRYPVASVGAHLVGYVAEISQRELDDPQFADYQPGRTVGKAGVERAYERGLAGDPGIRYVEVDALGRILGESDGRPEVEPEPGEDMRLHVDLPTQQWVARIFPDTLRGAIVALEPRTGKVRALYSHPSFDPNEFVGGIDPAQWRALARDSANRLLNRAIAGLYPPGSTFKLATAALGLELGVVNPQRYMPVPCRGGMRYGDRYFACWESDGHGYVALPDAIGRSCNVYFYQLGVQIGLDRFLTRASRMGFAAETGIDLPAERAGRFPSGAVWYRERFGWAPTPSEVLSIAIGQGPNSQTALGMAQFFAAIANGGRAPAPRVADLAGSAPGAPLELGFSERTLRWLREGMRRVVAEEGTAGLAALEHWEMIGKTGTAQNPHGPSHGWFVGLAGPEGEPPEIAVAVILEFAEHGWVAAQYAAKTADYYLRTKHGMPIDSIQTLRDHLLAGKPTPWADRD